MDQGSSLLLGIDGLIVDRVVIDSSGRRVVHCSTDPELAGWCPDCRQQSSSPKDRVTTRPRDLRIGPDRPDLLWHKQKWHCRVTECERKVFYRGTARGHPGAGADHYQGAAGSGAIDR